MAHLIKLEDYISRYQYDLNRYPSQYSRLKKERWYYLKSEWEQIQAESIEYEIEEQREEIIPKEEQGFLARVFQRLSLSKQRNVVEDEPSIQITVENERMKNITLAELKRSFLDDLFHSQLRWASSSLLEESDIHPHYKRDKWLRYFTQQLPDNYFLMYKPVFHVKKAPIELDIVIISPTDITCLTIIEGSDHSVFEANSNRFWFEYINHTKKKRISPLVSMSRMTGVIGWILEQEDITYPVQKVILSPTSLIDNKLSNTNTQLIDNRTIDSWMDKMKRHPSPLKHDQMKVTSLLLKYCETNSFQRLSDEDDSNENDNENEL